MNKALWLCLYFPALPLEVFTRAEASHPDQPIASSEHSRILCANPAALKQGVTIGQSTATASALTSKLYIIARDLSRETQALNQLALWCYQFSPMISVEPPNCLLLEIKGSLRLFKGLAPLQAQISAGIITMGYSCQQGLGHTAKSAQLFARSATNSELADTQSDAYHGLLNQLPLIYLDVPSQQITLLRDMGLSRLDQLLALPQPAIGKRLGIDFLHYLQKVIGERADPQCPISLQPDFHSELFYIEGIDNLQGLWFPFKRLLSELCQFLRSRQLYCQSFSWQLAEINHQARCLTITFSQAQNSLSAFLELTRIKLDASGLNSTIHNISLNTKDFVAAEPLARSLLGSSCETQDKPPELLLDKLSARLGKQALHGISPCQEHIPELAWQPRLLEQLKGSSDSISQAAPDSKKLRPLWLLPYPTPITQRHHQLYWQGRLTLLRGPERIDSHWWSQPGIQRDYFIARHATGGLYWIFRDLVSRDWFVHGIFS